MLDGHYCRKLCSPKSFELLGDRFRTLGKGLFTKTLKWPKMFQQRLDSKTSTQTTKWLNGIRLFKQSEHVCRHWGTHWYWCQWWAQTVGHSKESPEAWDSTPPFGSDWDTQHTPCPLWRRLKWSARMPKTEHDPTPVRRKKSSWKLTKLAILF